MAGQQQQEQPKGECAYCGVVMGKGGMSRHLGSCQKRRIAIGRAEREGAPAETLYQLRVEDRWDRSYWMDLEMRGSATLGALDTYLRGIWLECCGHLSRFSKAGWGTEEIGMRRRAAQVLGEGASLVHLYDFGTTSQTTIRVLRTRDGAPATRRPIALLARNVPPGIVCVRCAEPATHLCRECLERGKPGHLCAQHARRHGHREYGLAPLVNSPRVGMCGYDGPAEPPY